MLCVLKRTVSMIQMFKLIDKKKNRNFTRFFLINWPYGCHLPHGVGTTCTSPCTSIKRYCFSFIFLSLQEKRSIHDSMNIPKIEFIAYKYI